MGLYRRVAASFIRLATRRRKPRRAPVIALHCSGADAGQWRSLRNSLGEDYDLVAPEHYGCKAAGPWPGERAFTLADEAERTLALIDASDRPVHLVGHSYGGGVALKIAVERPERIASLSLYEPSAFHVLRAIGNRGAAAFAEIQTLVQRTVGGIAIGDHRGAAAAFVDYWNGHGAWDTLRPPVQAALMRWLPKAPLDFSALIEEPTALAAYASLRVPALVLRGEHALTPSRLIAETLWALLPAAELREIAGAGHMGPLTHTAAVNAAIVRHIARVEHCRQHPETRASSLARVA